MENNLVFEKQGNIYVASFISEGKVVIQLERKENGSLIVAAHLDGTDTPAIPVCDVRNGYTGNAIFNVDVPVGINVVIKSSSAVLNAYKLSVDEQS